MNAVAGLHDFFQINLGSLRNVLNVPGMPVAALITYTGMLQGSASVTLATNNKRDDSN